MRGCNTHVQTFLVGIKIDGTARVVGRIHRIDDFRRAEIHPAEETRAIESCDPDTLLQDEILEICRAQLEQMPELTQQIFKARRLEGKSYKEIAEQFGIPQKKVDKQLQQAVTKLRRALKDFFSIIFI